MSIIYFFSKTINIVIITNINRSNNYKNVISNHDF